MSFFNNVKAAFAGGREELTKQVGRFKHQKFLRATVAVCVRIAVTSNGISSEEKQKMLAFIKSSPELAVFDAKEVIDFFNSLTSFYDFDIDVGKGETTKHILALKDKPQEAQLAVRVGVAVAKSDGDFDSEEKKAVREICIALGLEPSEFDV